MVLCRSYTVRIYLRAWKLLAKWIQITLFMWISNFGCLVYENLSNYHFVQLESENLKFQHSFLIMNHLMMVKLFLGSICCLGQKPVLLPLVIQFLFDSTEGQDI